jgi:hypothetical protein
VTVRDRDTALKEFEAARAAFVDAYAPVPDEALTFLKPGEDYALGGLVTHVVAVLEHYQFVLSAVLEAGFGEVRPDDPPGFWEQQGLRAHAGLRPDERVAAFAELDRRHGAFVASLASLPGEDWDRKTPVWFQSAAEALPTSPGDICGWLNDHYLEHVDQVGGLHQEWVATRTG